MSSNGSTSWPLAKHLAFSVLSHLMQRCFDLMIESFQWLLFQGNAVSGDLVADLENHPVDRMLKRKTPCQSRFACDR